MSKGCFFITTFIIIILITESVNSQWEKINTPQIDVPIACFIIAVKGDTIFSGSYRATIFRSTNRGLTWLEVKKGFPSSLNAVSALFISDNKIFAGTNTGFYYSVDWGDNWIQSLNGLSDSYIHAIIKAENKIYTATDRGIYYSTDLGINWQPDTIGLPRNISYPDVILPVNSLIVVDSFIFAGTYSGVYFKNIKESNWQKRNNGILSEETLYLRINTLASDGNRIFAGSDYGSASVFVSNNLGESWGKVSNGLPMNSSGYYLPVYSFGINNNYIFAGTQYGIYLSKDYGQNWEPFNDGLPLGPASDLFVTSFTVTDTQIIASTFGGIYKLILGDSTWTPVFTKYPENVQIITLGASGNNLFLYTYANYWNGSINVNYFSSDNGKNWNENAYSEIRGPFLSIKDNFYSLGNGISISSDNGMSWTEIDSGLPQFGINDLILNDSIMYAAFGSYILNDDVGGIYKATKTDIVWDLIGLQDNPVHSLAQIDSTILAVSKGVFVYKFLFKSSDGGKIWLNIDSLLPSGIITTSTETLKKLFFVGTNHGVYSSSNLGISWHESNNGLPADDFGTYLPVSFIYSDKAIPVLKDYIFIGINNRLFISYDEGTSWQEIILTEDISELKSIAANENYIFINSINDILYLPVSLVTSIVSEQKNVQINFHLEQNYPNPFNPVTTIRYGIPQTSFVSLKIYDLLGREVATLVDEYNPAGNYEVKFYASRLSSGVYFYKIQAGDYVNVRKMILIR